MPYAGFVTTLCACKWQSRPALTFAFLLRVLTVTQYIQILDCPEVSKDIFQIVFREGIWNLSDEDLSVRW